MNVFRTAERPPAIDENDWRFLKIKSGQVRAFTRKAKDAAGNETGEDRYIIAGTASSSVIDLYGDLLTDICQASMLAQADGLTMWLNHSYIVPEDIAGTCTNPQLKHATADDGIACIDLEIELEIDPENPRMMKSWRSVQRGTQLAFSIGGFFTVYELVFEDENDWWGHFVVDDIKLLEISLVGIPANPRAYTKTFEKARAAVVAAAEAIAKEARVDQSIAQKRIEVRKTFGLPGEIKEKSIDMNCSHKDGCEKPRATKSEYCKDHAGVMLMKAAPADDPVQVQCMHEPACDTYEAHEQKAAPATEAPTTEVKTVTDDSNVQSKIVECMKSIVKCVNSPGHQMCAEPQAHAQTALSIAKSALPDEYDLPEDAQLGVPGAATFVAFAGGETVDIQKKIDELNETVKSLGEQISTLNGDLEKLNADKTQLSTDVETLKAEKTALDEKIAELKATPTGRSSKSHTGGSSNESESTVSPEMYQRSKTELSEAANRAASKSGTQDARQSVQVTT